MKLGLGAGQGLTSLPGVSLGEPRRTTALPVYIRYCGRLIVNKLSCTLSIPCFCPSAFLSAAAVWNLIIILVLSPKELKGNMIRGRQWHNRAFIWLWTKLKPNHRFLSNYHPTYLIFAQPGFMYDCLVTAKVLPHHSCLVASFIHSRASCSRLLQVLTPPFPLSLSLPTRSVFR